MINKYRGETIKYDIHIEDSDGTAITGANPILRVKDAGGGSVLTGNGTYISDGTYSISSGVGGTWGTGPLSYYWDVKNASGTGLKAVTNEINIIAGTVEPSSYVYESELSSYYSPVVDYFNDHTQDKIIASYNLINRMLESINIKTPREKNSDGFYDQSLRDMNAWFAIYNIVQDQEANRVPPGEEAWYRKFYKNGMDVYDSIKNKKIIFRDQVSPSESGINKPYRSAGSSIATMVNNWDRAYGNGFKGDDYARTWNVTIVGTGTSGNLSNCIFNWSINDGISIAGTGTTSMDWVHLQDEVYIRWTRGTATGTENIFQMGDKWKFDTNPLRTQVGGINVARSY